jgi:hypothetical protein
MDCSSVLRMTLDSSVERLSVLPRLRRSPADQHIHAAGRQWCHRRHMWCEGAMHDAPAATCGAPWLYLLPR